MKGLTYGAASWLVILFVWSLLTYTEVIQPFFLPKPHEVFQDLVPILFGIKRTGWDSSPDFWVNLLITGKRVAISIFLASLMAIPIGIAMGRFQKIRRVTEPITEFFRALPVTILYPVFGFVFGYFDDGSKIAMAVFGSGLVLTVGICEGVKNCDSEIVDAARIDGAGEFELIRNIIWYLALPYTYTSLRVGLSLAVVLVIVTEVSMGGGNGLGYVVYERGQSYHLAQMWAFIILTGCFGLTLNSTLEKLKPRLIPWL